MESTIWTPQFSGSYEFRVYLDHIVAREAVRLKHPSKVQMRMNEIANQELQRLGINWTNPYTFHGDSGFITQVNIGQNGVWLSTDHQTIEDLLDGKESPTPVEFHSHNVDTPTQAYSLMVLFGKWVEYFDAFRSN